jgi:hypothetical protein
MRIRRLEFTRAFLYWDENDWKHMIFPDESHFKPQFGNQSSRCWCPAELDPFSLKFTRNTVKPSQKVIACGCFS